MPMADTQCGTNPQDWRPAAQPKPDAAQRLSGGRGVSHARNENFYHKLIGGGGSRTLVPWQVEEHFYMLRLQVNVESWAAGSLTAHDPSRSCVLTDDRSTLSSGHSAGRQFFAGRGLPTGTGLPFFRQPAEGRSPRLLGT